MSRVFISTFSCICPLGCDTEIGDALERGDNTFMISECMPGTACAPVRTFDAVAATHNWRHRKYLNRGACFALAAALRACPDTLPEDTDLITAFGPNLDISAEFPFPALYAAWREKSASDAGRYDPSIFNYPEQDALWILRSLPNTVSSAIAQRLGVHGEPLVIGNACAASLQALGEGARRIRSGAAQTVVVAAGDSRLSYGALLGYRKAHALHTPLADSGAVSQVMRPFDRQRSGFAPGEGGAAFLLESEAQLAVRHAQPIAELLGFGASLDAGSLTAPDKYARWALKASQKALHEAAQPTIDWIAAHGTSTLLNDAAEAHLIQQLFPQKSPAVTALKSWIGHLGSACGAVELAVMLQAAQRNILPVIRNLVEPCNPYPDFVLQPRSFFNGDHSTGLLHSFGFGGHNAALVVRIL